MIGKTTLTYDEVITALAYSIWTSELSKRTTLHAENTSLAKSAGYQKLNSATEEATAYINRNQSSAIIIKFIDDILNGLQVVVVLNEDTRLIYVVFRCGNETQPWLVTNKSCKCNISSKISVHMGILELIEIHQISLFQTIDKLISEYPSFSICVTGYGLGGAISTLFGFMTAQRLSSTNNCQVTVISFGAPRVGNYFFREAVDRTENLTCIRARQCYTYAKADSVSTRTTHTHCFDTHCLLVGAPGITILIHTGLHCVRSKAENIMSHMSVLQNNSFVEQQWMGVMEELLPKEYNEVL